MPELTDKLNTLEKEEPNKIEIFRKKFLKEYNNFAKNHEVFVAYAKPVAAIGLGLITLGLAIKHTPHNIEYFCTEYYQIKGTVLSINQPNTGQNTNFIVNVERDDWMIGTYKPKSGILMDQTTITPKEYEYTGRIDGGSGNGPPDLDYSTVEFYDKLPDGVEPGAEIEVAQVNKYGVKWKSARTLGHIIGNVAKYSSIGLILGNIYHVIHKHGFRKGLKTSKLRNKLNL
jgi:hypothetical protein